MSTNEIEDSRAALKALQLAHRNHLEEIAIMKSAIAEAEESVRDATRELGEIAKAEAVAAKDRLARLKTGGDAAKSAGREQREAVERQSELRDDLTGSQAALELLRAELATEQAQAEKLEDELMYAAERVITAELEATAAALSAEIDSARAKWLEIRAITDRATVPEWRQLHGYPQPVRASRGLRYGRPMQILLESTIAQNTVFDKAKFDADWSKWNQYFDALKVSIRRAPRLLFWNAR
jgi:hypothetical protein